MQWHISAGGTYAAPNKNGHTAVTEIGNYRIQPISHQRNSNHHKGYQVTFVNCLGRLDTPLHTPLAPNLINLQQAKKLCKEHYQKHGNLRPYNITILNNSRQIEVVPILANRIARAVKLVLRKQVIKFDQVKKIEYGNGNLPAKDRYDFADAP